MPKDRYYFSGELKRDKTILLTDSEAHHLMHVMRNRVGDLVEIVNGRGALAVGKVVNCTRREVALEITEWETTPLRPHPKLTLAIAYLNPSRLELAVEKCTELGVDAFTLYDGARGARKLSVEGVLKRIDQVIIAASKQSGRVWFPEVHCAPPIGEWTESSKKQLYFGTLEQKRPKLIAALQSDHSKASSKEVEEIAFVVGPESGFSPEEERHLEEIGARGVSLGNCLLRSETAAILAAGILQHTV
ncbi:MAG: 16S rRNA (uracil(1498)-N(3))-methyltransferase [Chlamydiia bacterium]|nr:16S rRNA (uracil(1498)-N(3))-methyltransferase [Chlamydiia bacterium]